MTACGGGGGTTAQPVEPTPPSTWSLTKMTSGGSVRSYTAACGSYDIVAKGDLNGDGNDDFVLGPKANYNPAKGCADPGFTKLIVAFYDPTSKTYKQYDLVQSVMPEMQWTSVATVGDFNNDGYSDIFAAGTGTDYGQPCGEAPVLMIGSASGFVNKSHLLPRFSMYTHQAVWSDFNGDGKTDFALINNNWVPTNASDPKQAECSYRKFAGSNESYVVLSSGDTWTHAALRVNDNNGNVLIDGNQSYNSAFASDVDQDGKSDMVIIGSNWGSIAQQAITLKGQGNGSFVFDSKFTETPFGSDTVASNISIRQLDTTAPLEMVVNYTKHPGGQAIPFQNSVYRVFRYNASTWSNVTDLFLANKTSATETDLTYCARLYWVDINSDGKDDFVCSSMNSPSTDNIDALSPRIWLRTTDNKFEPAYHSGFSIVGAMSNMTPVYVDSKVKIVGIRNANFGATIQINIAE